MEDPSGLPVLKQNELGEHLQGQGVEIIEGLVSRCFSQRPKSRPSFKEIVAELERMLAETTLPSVVDSLDCESKDSVDTCTLAV